MSHTDARRASTVILISVAFGVAIAGPAAAAPTTKPASTSERIVQICPGILCEPFWKTDRDRILNKRVP